MAFEGRRLTLAVDGCRGGRVDLDTLAGFSAAAPRRARCTADLRGVPRRLSVSRSGEVTFPVRCSEGCETLLFLVKQRGGTLKLAKNTSSSFEAGAGAAGSMTLKLAAFEQERLRRLRRLQVTLVALTGRPGSRRTRTSRRTVLLPPA